MATNSGPYANAVPVDHLGNPLDAEQNTSANERGIGAIPGRATAAVPALAEGKDSKLSMDLQGRLRVTETIGVKKNNFAANIPAAGSVSSDLVSAEVFNRFRFTVFYVGAGSVIEARVIARLGGTATDRIVEKINITINDPTLIVRDLPPGEARIDFVNTGGGATTTFEATVIAEG